MNNRIDLKRLFAPWNDSTTANLSRRGAYRLALAMLAKEHSISFAAEEGEDVDRSYSWVGHVSEIAGCRGPLCDGSRLGKFSSEAILSVTDFLHWIPADIQ